MKNKAPAALFHKGTSSVLYESSPRFVVQMKYKGSRGAQIGGQGVQEVGTSIACMLVLEPMKARRQAESLPLEGRAGWEGRRPGERKGRNNYLSWQSALVKE